MIYKLFNIRYLVIINIFICSLATTILLSGCQSQKAADLDLEINVLFIGNSLTYYNDMPQILQAMLDETDPHIKIDQITFPGISLDRHLGKNYSKKSKIKLQDISHPSETVEKILEKKWNVIILQTGTVQLLIPEARKHLVEPAIKDIINLVDKNNPECRVILFNTWPSKSEYPKQYCYIGKIIHESLIGNQNYCSDIIENLDKEIELINTSYNDVSYKFEIEKTNHGSIYYKIYKNYPKIELLEDDIHPSKIGAFLNACIFYQKITEKKVKNISYNGEIDDVISSFLKNIIN